MQAASINPYEGKLCRIMIKSKIIYNARWEETYVEAVIAKWAREGIYLDDGNFLPWSNIGAVSPIRSDEIKPGLETIKNGDEAAKSSHGVQGSEEHSQ